MPNSNEKTIVWLDDTPELSPEIPRIAKEQSYLIRTCTGVAGFLQAIQAFETKPEEIKAFILERVIRLEKIEDLQALQQMIPGIQRNCRTENDAGPLLFANCLRKNAQSPFFGMPVLFHTITQNMSKDVVCRIAHPSRYDVQDPARVENGVSCIVKQGVPLHMPDYLQKLQAWFSSLKAA